MAERQLPVKVEKPWGGETIFAWTDRYVGKILHVKAGHSLSLQYHRVKDETIYLAAGRMDLEVEEAGQMRRVGMVCGDFYRIRPEVKHRMHARDDCTVFEVSTPELDDVVRLVDSYGREGTSAP